MKRNNAIPNNHFKKTALMYKTWFGQPAKAQRRREIRAGKARRVAPMPTQKLRPVVRCPTIRHNKKVRLGRGFTAEELKAAGLDYHYARTVGIAVDLRRVNQNEEGFSLNVARIKEYIGKIVIYGTKQEAVESGAVQHTGTILPVYNNAPIVETIAVSDIASYN